MGQRAARLGRRLPAHVWKWGTAGNLGRTEVTSAARQFACAEIKVGNLPAVTDMDEGKREWVKVGRGKGGNVLIK